MIKLNYTFKDESLLETALTQSGANAAHNNERLEFVGDRVLGLTVAEMLYNMYPTEAEGEFSVAGLKAIFAAKATRISPRLTSF